jgi:hypothetical protein
MIAKYKKASNSTFLCNETNPDSPCKDYGTVNTTGKITNTQAWGSLRSYNPIGCENLENLTNEHTPADVIKGLTKCLKQKRFKKGAYLHAFAGIYAYFDRLRVADKTAHGAHSMLLAQNLRSVRDSMNPFKKEVKNVLGEKTELSKVCKKIIKIGAPGYHPMYMIHHGLNTLNGGGTQNGLVNEFNSDNAWKVSLEKFLKCPNT